MATKLQATTTVEVTQTVKLSPKQRTEARALMGQITDITVQESSLDKAKKAAKEKLETLFADAGEYDALIGGVDIDGLRIKLVQPEGRESYDDKRLLSHLTPAQLAACKVRTPGTPYLKVSKEKA